MSKTYLIAIIVVICSLLIFGSSYWVNNNKTTDKTKVNTDIIHDSVVLGTYSEKTKFKKDSIVSQYNIDEPYTLNWKLLSDIEYSEIKDSIYPEGIMYPKVNTKLKTLLGREVVLKGYVIPIDEESYAISKNQMASCFFCGAAGPESISGINFKDGNTQRLKTDKFITVKGIFRYNETNPDDWIYNIDGVVVIE